MRLLDTETGLFHDVANALDASYAILSHRWQGEHEQSYQELCTIQADYLNPSALRLFLLYIGHVLLHLLPSRPLPLPLGSTFSAPLSQLRWFYAELTLGWVQFVTRLAYSWAYPCALADRRVSRKIREACAYARADGHKYLWIDSCCINQSSSAELSEAINAMYRWYEIAVVCYAYLADVWEPVGEQFYYSQWHTRGWTLQELLAPDVVVFVSANWQFIGTKASMASYLERRLAIASNILTKARSVRSVAVARVMSWAVSRECTREEDKAYCLMGLFGIHMPTLYGEGHHAFVRLQEAIWTRKRDASVFLWNYTTIPKRVKELRDYCVDNRVGDEVTRFRSRVGRVEIRRVDYQTHYAMHPSDYLIGRSIITLTSKEYAEFLGHPRFSHSGWNTPSAHGAPSPVPCIPLRALLPASPEGVEEKSSESLANLFAVPLPYGWRDRLPGPPTGLLAIVCSEIKREATLEASPSTPDVPVQLARSSKVLQSVTLHDRQLRRSSAYHASRLILLTRADLARCHTHIYPHGSLFCDPYRSSPPSLTRLPPVREDHQVQAESKNRTITVVFANWSRRTLGARGYRVSPLDALPELAIDGIDTVLGYKLLPRHHPGLTILVQHSPPSTDGGGFDVSARLLLRIGLLTEGPSRSPSSSPDSEGEDREKSPPERAVSWSKWTLLREGRGCPMELADPRNDAKRFAFRTIVRYESHDVYALSLELVSYTRIAIPRSEPEGGSLGDVTPAGKSEEDSLGDTTLGSKDDEDSLGDTSTTLGSKDEGDSLGDTSTTLGSKDEGDSLVDITLVP
ncbi:hypothetical protein C2E23DRAFT_845605 [Lenzites betulinus]|nr:hypothetical protein C2E23DRAFT_845605 [Lenzites betulinus]